PRGRLRTAPRAASSRSRSRASSSSAVRTRSQRVSAKRRPRPRRTPNPTTVTYRSERAAAPKESRPMRTATKPKLYSLTDEHRAQLEPWARRWIANAMSTKAMDDVDRAATRAAVRGLYEAAGLRPPPDHRIVFVPSPFVAAFAAGFAA